jgi:GntR family transcriptional repressor for pyruvate dehydrogenase complex
VARNVVVLHVMRVRGELLRSDIFYNRNQLYRRFGVRKQHLSIASESIKGDPKATEKAAFAHINYTFQTIEDIRRDEERAEVSLRRVSRSDLLVNS